MVYFAAQRIALFYNLPSFPLISYNEKERKRLPPTDSHSDAFDNRRFLGDVLRKALTEALSSLGATWREMIFDEMAKSGMTFENDKGYSINDIRPRVLALFEEDMGEVFLERVRKHLRANE